MTTENNINTTKVTADKTDQRPSCACGRGDLYGEWLKQNEKEENTSTSVQGDKPVSSYEDLTGVKPEQKHPLK